MKKGIAVLLCAVLLLVLCACGGAAAAAGVYTIESLSMGGETMQADTLAEMGLDISSFKMELKEDGTFVMMIFALVDLQEVSGAWTAEGNKLALEAEGVTVNGVIEGNKITLTDEGTGMAMVFVKE